jgi:hypothetical protein
LLCFSRLDPRHDRRRVLIRGDTLDLDEPHRRRSILVGFATAAKAPQARDPEVGFDLVPADENAAVMRFDARTHWRREFMKFSWHYFPQCSRELSHPEWE